jgi:hypothetical protein
MWISFVYGYKNASTRNRLWKIKSYRSKTLNSRSPGIYIDITEPMVILSEGFDERLEI